MDSGPPIGEGMDIDAVVGPEGHLPHQQMACIYATAPGVGTSSGIRRVTPTGCAIPDDTSIDQAWTRDVDLRDIGQIYKISERQAGRERAEKISMLIHALGSSGQAYRREKARSARHIISEVYSAPRVTEMARRLPKYGLGPGLALDFTVNDEDGRPFNFNDKRQREKAERMLEDQQPFILIGSPPCTPFSQIQAINGERRDPNEVEKELIAGRVHLEFCCSLY